MKLLVQRVSRASVEVEGDLIASIDTGALVFVGFDKEDNLQKLNSLSDKLLNYKIFNDSDGKVSLSLKETNNDIFDELTFENISLIGELLMNKFLAKEFDKIEIVYNKFKNAATQIVTTEQFLPIENNNSEDDQNDSADYIFEPSQIEIISELIPKSLKTQLYKSVRDSYASEHGARMTAMHKATDNATELRDQLKLTYNKARQASITNEILEIVGGAEALNG